MFSFCYFLSWTDVNTSCAGVVTLAIAADAAELDTAAPKVMTKELWTWAFPAPGSDTRAHP